MTNNEIVKTYWEGKLSNLEILSIKSFIKNKHKIFIYTYDKSLMSFDKDMIIMDASEIVPEEKRKKIGKIMPSIFSDFFRYYLLYKTGGWWVDLDIVLIKPVTTENQIVISSFIRKSEWGTQGINNAPLKIPKEHVLAKACVERAEAVDLQKLVHAQIAGPLLEKEVKALGLQGHVVIPEIYSPIGSWEAHRVVEPKFGFDKITKNTVAVHLFNTTWSFGRSLDKNGKYHPESLYEYLKIKYGVNELY
jgi:hypothetical protein